LSVVGTLITPVTLAYAVWNLALRVCAALVSLNAGVVLTSQVDTAAEVIYAFDAGRVIASAVWVGVLAFIVVIATLDDYEGEQSQEKVCSN